MRNSETSVKMATIRTHCARERLDMVAVPSRCTESFSMSPPRTTLISGGCFPVGVSRPQSRRYTLLDTGAHGIISGTSKVLAWSFLLFEATGRNSKRQVCCVCRMDMPQYDSACEVVGVAEVMKQVNESI